jgi:hypothetical protein
LLNKTPSTLTVVQADEGQAAPSYPRATSHHYPED